MNKTLRLLIPVTLLGTLAVGAIFAKPATAQTEAAYPQITASLDGLQDAPRLRVALRRIIRELDLSPAQIDSARTVVRSHHRALEVALDGVLEAREELRTTIRHAPTDEAALAAGADAVAAAHRELALVTARLRADLRGILNAEQLARVDAFEGRMDDRIEQVRERVSQWIAAK